eukprot:COSAG02_NODE_10418_length_1945_cov_6.796477_2_plen_46_part_01
MRVALYVNLRRVRVPRKMLCIVDVPRPTTMITYRIRARRELGALTH